MPDPVRTATPNAKKPDNAPLWARAVHVFYDPIFDIRTREQFQSTLDDFVQLSAGERAFHETHLLYRAVQGLEAIHGALHRIDGKLGALASADLAALEHLEPIRGALEEIASGQGGLFEAAGWSEREEEEEDERDVIGEEPDLDGDPDSEEPAFIYDTIPEEVPDKPWRPRPPPAAELPPALRTPPPVRAESPRPPTPRDPEREALVGDLVPATEGPQRGAEGDR